MNPRLQTILDEARKLARSERLELLAALLNNLDSPAAVEAAWADEIRQRLSELNAGGGANG